MEHPHNSSPKGGASLLSKVAPVIGVVAVAIGFWFLPRGADRTRDPEYIFAQKERQAHNRPNDFDTQMAWAEALVQAKRFEDAEPVLEQARRLNPKDARPNALLGRLSVLAGQDAEARDLFHSALQLDASNITALRGLANLDAKTRHLRAAINGFQRIVQLQPNDADAWQGLGLMLISARENYRSLDALAHAAAIAPDDLITERALGTMALNAGKLDQAKTAFQIVLKHDSNDAPALTGLADVMMRTDPSPTGLAAAEKQASDAIRAAATAQAYYLRGYIRMTEHHLPQALEDLNSSLELDPKHRQTYVVLSQCYAQAGKPDMAKRISARFDKLSADMLARDKTLLHAGKPK